MADVEKTALVTGANKGIGFEVARQLARDHGFLVLLGARDPEKGEAAAQALQGEGLNVRFLRVDVADDASVQNAAQTVDKEFGRVSVVVSNAGAGFDFDQKPTTNSLSDAHAAFETNFWGGWRVAQAFVPLLRKSEPSGSARLVLVSSQAGAFTPTSGSAFSLAEMAPGAPAYGAAKAALNALTIKLAADVKDDGILVNAVCPGFTATFPGAEAMGARPIADGAASVVWAALLPNDGPTGGFFRDGEPLPW